MELMRAVETNGNTASLTTAPVPPEPSAGQALIRPTRVLVDDDDVQIAGGVPPFHGVLGRFAVGVVERGPTELSGRRVVIAPDASCGECELCRRGLAAHCQERTILGVEGRDGCLAEWLVVPARSLHPVPDGLDDDHAAFAGPVASALHAARQLTIEGRPYITVLGDTLVALLTVQVMARLNASVRLLGWQPSILSQCEKWGIKHRQVMEVGRRRDQDVVVLCSTRPEAWETAMGLVRPRGAVVLKSMCHVDAGPLIRMREISVLGSFLGRLDEGLAAIRGGAVDVVSLISRRCRLGEGDAIIRAAADAQTIAVLVEP